MSIFTSRKRKKKTMGQGIILRGKLVKEILGSGYPYDISSIDCPAFHKYYKMALNYPIDEIDIRIKIAETYKNIFTSTVSMAVTIFINFGIMILVNYLMKLLPDFTPVLVILALVINIVIIIYLQWIGLAKPHWKYTALCYVREQLEIKGI